MGCFFIVDPTGFIAGPSSRVAQISITDGEVSLSDTIPANKLRNYYPRGPENNLATLPTPLRG